MTHQPIISEAYTAAAVSVKKKKHSLLSLTPAFRLGTLIRTLPPGFSPDLSLYPISLSYWKHIPQQLYRKEEKKNCYLLIKSGL
jgi:hypothetical protein